MFPHDVWINADVAVELVQDIVIYTSTHINKLYPRSGADLRGPPWEWGALIKPGMQLISNYCRELIKIGSEPVSEK